MKRGLKVLTLVFSFVFALSVFIGCDGSKPNSSSISSQSEISSQSVSSSEVIEDATIEWWNRPIWPGGLFGMEDSADKKGAEWPQAIITKFNKEFPNITVNFTVLEGQDAPQKLAVAALAGTAPDITYVDSTSVIEYQGLIEPIDETMFASEKDKYMPEMIQKGSYDGKLYYWPLYYETIGLVVNLDIAKERGVENLVPAEDSDRTWTTDNFLKFVQACTYDTNSDGEPDVYGTGLAGANSFYFNNYFLMSFGAQAFNADRTEILFGSEKGLNGLKFLSDLVHKYKVVPQGAAALKYGDMRTMFLQKKIAVIPTFPNIAILIKNGIEKGDIKEPFNFRPVKWPNAPGEKAVNGVSPFGFCIFNQDNDNTRKAANAFARFLTNDENMSTVSKNIGIFPSKKSVGNIYGDDKVAAFFAGLVTSGQSDPDYVFGNRAMYALLGPMYQSVFSGDATPEVAMTNFTNAAKETLKK